MSTYCERAGLALQTIRFSFDGTRINESDTPKGLDMEDGDTIEVFQQQSGGSLDGREGSTCCSLFEYSNSPLRCSVRALSIPSL